MSDQLFKLGQTVATPGALVALQDNNDHALRYLVKHVTGDWGELEKEDIDANNNAIKENERILSSYKLQDGTKIWVITEADRSSTTILLPEEY